MGRKRSKRQRRLLRKQQREYRAAQPANKQKGRKRAVALGFYRPPADIMELLAEDRWYNKEGSAIRLNLVARYIDDPVKLKEFEERWLYLYDRNMLN